MNVTINNRTLEASPGETILEVAARAAISIPTLCHMEGLPPTGACRMCVVEDMETGNLIPSCSQPAFDGMRINTHSPKALTARRTIVELLLANHPDDCLYCIRNGCCTLQGYSEELGVRQRRYNGERSTSDLDVSSPSIVRDPDKCILCGKCVRVCEEIQGVSAIDFQGRGSDTRIGCAFKEGLNVSSCINCGQCIMVCPTGALAEKDDTARVIAALRNPDITVVVQHAPAISVTIAEDFGMKPGTDIVDRMNGALRRMGFDYIFPTSFGADLTAIEEANELVERITSGGPLPLFTSCSPGWIKFMEEFYPDLVDNVSSCKSPQQMLGAVIKRVWTKEKNIDPRKVFHVSIMPCTAKKFECDRTGMRKGSVRDVDAVLTTREFIRMIKMFGIDLKLVTGEPADNPYGERSSAGKIFGVSGGVMEAAIRTAFHMLTGEDLPALEVKELRGFDGIKEVAVYIGDLELKAAVVSGLGNARKLLDRILSGEKTYHFVEIMTCPGGCIAGGGQPFTSDPQVIRSRMTALYSIDSAAPARTAHSNVSLKKLYNDHLEKPGSHAAHEMLHTVYARREVLK
ncbi:MAG: [FeFe] hydrogenase, group A [Candidatus Sabulitectum sp.]|nr:[FeFe] hydrogenase, group A [Candidatus Sabulitectum sp.]